MGVLKQECLDSSWVSQPFYSLRRLGVETVTVSALAERGGARCEVCMLCNLTFSQSHRAFITSSVAVLTKYLLSDSINPCS